MKKLIGWVLLAALLVPAGRSWAQLSQMSETRRPQKELFAGFAIPTAPQTFKDYYKVGLSLHGQYVIFPTPSLGVSVGAAFEGFTFDGTKFVNDYEAANPGTDFTGLSLSATGSARVIELGVGIRPYLTPPTANNQIFLFGMGTLNFLHDSVTPSVTGPDQYGNTTTISETITDNQTKPGLAAGAGLEIPAGEKFNVIVQALYRDILTKDKSTSFVGLTAGVVF